MLNYKQINFKWTEIKGGIRNLWAGISNEELDKIKGNIPAVMGLVQEKYGESKENIEEKIESLLDSFDNETDLSGRSESSYMRNPTAEDHPSSSR